MNYSKGIFPQVAENEVVNTVFLDEVADAASKMPPLSLDAM